MAARTRRRDSAGHVDPFHKRRVRFREALQPLGVWESFVAMPRWAQEHFFKCKVPDFAIAFDESLPDRDFNRKLHAELDTALGKATVDIDGGTIRLRDFYAVVLGCIIVCNSTKAVGKTEPLEPFIGVAHLRLIELFNTHESTARREIYHATIKPIAAHSRLQKQLLIMGLHAEPTAKGLHAPRLMVGAVAAEERRVTLDGMARPMVRVGTQLHGGAHQWVSWTGQQLGRSGADEAERQYPLYVQSHALLQLERRANLKEAAPYLEAWLTHSLEAANIVERQGENLLVEFQIQDKRIGYLVATPMRDLIAIRTFLFLTMDGTPEARLLHRRLKLTRRDTEWLGLCDLKTFTHSDLRDDPVLRPMLEDCGCGQLFELDDLTDFAPQPKALAAEMRKYLRMAA